MNTLVNALEREDNVAYTANGAVSHASTLDANLDLFGAIGALRGQGPKATRLFQKALGEDPLNAMRILFYGRDIRGGQGERGVFQDCLQFLAKNYPDYLEKNIHLVTEYGYWKDLFVLFGTQFENRVLDMIQDQWVKDLDAEHPSLLAKWLPSENTSSKKTRALAKKVREHLGLVPSAYRRSLSGLRKRLKVVERDLSAKNFGEIEYSRVPSRANLRYTKAFLRNDEDRFREYLGKVEKGEAKMNAGALYPYDITARYCRGYRVGNRPSDDKALQALWNSLPNYLEGKPHNGLVVCDVSGSMYSGRGNVAPITVSTSLALYIAERMEGPFANSFITFSERPKFVKLQGEDLYTKMSNLCQAEWGYSTDVQAVFRLVLRTAQKHSVVQKDMPDVIYIVSDMQFNSCGGKTNLTGIKQQYKAAGYTMPKLVFWNVNAQNDDNPITKHDENTALVSGCNPNIFEAVLSGKTPLDVMLNVIESERYAPISV